MSRRKSKCPFDGPEHKQPKYDEPCPICGADGRPTDENEVLLRDKCPRPEPGKATR